MARRRAVPIPPKNRPFHGHVQYTSNNSGGNWWLTDEDWKNLEAAGWIVYWVGKLETYYNNDGNPVRDSFGIPKLVPIGQGNPERPGFPHRVDADGKWLGALATYAYRPGLHLREAADEWERVVKKSALEAGCPCCGPPHSFTEYDEKGRYVTSGPETNYEASW